MEEKKTADGTDVTDGARSGVPPIEEMSAGVSPSSEPSKESVDAASTRGAETHERRSISARLRAPLAFVCGILVVVGGIHFFVREEQREAQVQQFTHVYTFVPEKISTNAYIPVRLPEGISKESAVQGITFTPSLKGEWVTESDPGFVVFNPKDPLELTMRSHSR